jgi:hypothetical protein
MSAAETVARNLATRFAPEIDPRLPIAVERVIAEGEHAGSPYLSPDAAQVQAFASFVVAVAGVASSVILGLKNLDKTSELAKANAKAEAYRDVVLELMAQQAPRPPQLGEGLRVQVLEAGADEAIAEEKRREAQR